METHRRSSKSSYRTAMALIDAGVTPRYRNSSSKDGVKVRRSSNRSNSNKNADANSENRSKETAADRGASPQSVSPTAARSAQNGASVTSQRSEIPVAITAAQNNSQLNTHSELVRVSDSASSTIAAHNDASVQNRPVRTQPKLVETLAKPSDALGREPADINMLVASALATQQRRPNVNSLASEFASKKLDSLGDKQSTNMATPRTLKSLSNIKAAASRSSGASTVRSALKSNEVEERRKKLIIEARKKLQEIALLEKRNDTQDDVPNTNRHNDNDERRNPSPSASAKSESYLRKLHRDSLQENATALLKQQAAQQKNRQLTSSPVETNVTRESVTSRVSKTARTADANLDRQSSTNSELDSGNTVPSKTLPRNFHLADFAARNAVYNQNGVTNGSVTNLNSPAVSTNGPVTLLPVTNVPISNVLPNNVTVVPVANSNGGAVLANATLLPIAMLANATASSSSNGNRVLSQSNLNAAVDKSANSAEAATKTLKSSEATDGDHMSSPDTVISIGAYHRTSLSGQQNAISVANLVAELQPRGATIEPRLLTNSTSSYSVVLEAAGHGAKSAVTAVTDVRRAARRAVIKRNVCIQCNLTRSQPEPQPTQTKGRRAPPLHKVLKNYELVTFTLRSSNENTAVDYGIRLFESLFVEDSTALQDDTPWSINGKRPVLSSDSSAFRKVSKAQSEATILESLLAIDSLVDNSVAQRDGRLCVGDYVIEVNGTSVLTQACDAAQRLLNAASELVLVVARTMQQSTDEQLRSDRLLNKGSLSRALQSELALLKSKYDRLKSEMKRNEVLISEMRNAVARKAKIKQVLKAQQAESAKAPVQNSFKTILVEEQLVHVV